MTLAHPESLSVCIVAPYDLSTRGGGVKHHIAGLARALRGLGDRVTVLGPARAPVGEAGVVTVGGVLSLQSNGSANEMALFASPFEVASFFRTHAFDVVHVHEPAIPSLGYWVAWLTPGVPKICTFHAFADAPPLPLRVGQRFFGALQYPFFAAGLAVSEAAAEYASRAWKRRLSIVPNGIDTDAFTPPATSFPGGGLRLLFVGRLADERKGWSVMLDAYRLLRDRGVDASLDVVGDASGAVVPALPGLRAHGALPRAALIDAYRACDLFVAPSTRQESFGIVLLEAMATGRPIVCSDIRGYREVAPPAGTTFVPPASASALADAIAALAPEEARRAAMGGHNRRAVLRYRWDVVAEEVREHYLDVCSRGEASARADASRAEASSALPSRKPTSSTGIVWRP